MSLSPLAASAPVALAQSLSQRTRLIPAFGINVNKLNLSRMTTHSEQALHLALCRCVFFSKPALRHHWPERETIWHQHKQKDLHGTKVPRRVGVAKFKDALLTLPIRKKFTESLSIAPRTSSEQLNGRDLETP